MLEQLTTLVPRTVLHMMALPDAAIDWKWILEMPNLPTKPVSTSSSTSSSSDSLLNKLPDSVKNKVTSIYESVANSSVAKKAAELSNNIQTPYMLMMMAQSVTVPQESISTNGIITQARERDFPSKISTSDLSITFYEDLNYTCLNYLTYWKSCVITEEGVYGLPGGENGYAKDIKVYLFDSAGLQKGILTLNNCYCVNVDDISLNSDSPKPHTTTAKFSVHRSTFSRTALASVSEKFSVIKAGARNTLSALNL